LLPALSLARRAAAAGMQCVVTSSIDSACGVLAAAHLAAALDNGLAHGLATSSWLTADTGTPPTITNGRLALPDTPGLGFVADNTLDFSGMGQELDIS
jgi:L-alanine-DL-glutamate epimerase-like enolase superfamily enzyme